MEGPGGPTAALPMGQGNGNNGGQQQPQQQQPQWGTQFYNPHGNDMAQQNHHHQQNQNQLHHHQQQQQQQQQQQILQHQQLIQLAAAAAASGQGPHHQLNQAPTINMMLQGMANQGMGHSPSNSGFLLLQQPAGLHHQGDISPGSTPGLGGGGGGHPGPSATPPTMLDERGWQQSMYHHRGQMEEMKSPNDMFMDSGYRQQQQQEMLNQMQMQELLAARSQYPYPAQSPPAMFHHGQMMPPRPRPEGQDPPGGANFLKEDSAYKANKNMMDDLVVIDSWTGGAASSSGADSEEKYYSRMQEEKEEMTPTTGWGAPPPTNPNGWGQPPPQQPKIGNWQQQPPPGPPPPNNNLFGGPPPNYDARGRGGFDSRRGFQQPPNRGRGNSFVPQDNSRAMRGMGRGGYPMASSTSRGRGRGLPNRLPPSSAVEREQEKQDGKKNAIAETIAMMNKMKMEDKERKDAHQKIEEERRRELGLPDPPPAVTQESPTSESYQDDTRIRRGRGSQPTRSNYDRYQHGGRGRAPRGPRGGMMMPPAMFGGHPNPAAAAAAAAAMAAAAHQGGPGMFLPPPGVPGFPGMEQLFMNPGFPGGHQPPFFNHPLGLPPGQFPGQFRFPGERFPSARGMGRGFHRMPPRNVRPSRGRGNASTTSTSSRDKLEEPKSESSNEVRENVAEEEENHVEEPPLDHPEASSNGDSVEAAAPEAAVMASDENPPKNVNSGQGTPKGQLALSASQSPNSSKGKRSKSDLNLRDRLSQQLVAGQAECMVCLEKIKPKNATWHCDGECFQVFHIHCIKKWSKIARTNDSNNQGWRCPGCQFVRKTAPKEYKCFCGKLVDPPYERREIPHSCGEPCGKPLKSADAHTCLHKCMELCHPGPCPPCVANVIQTCPCGQTSQNGRCGSSPICTNVCGKLLLCGNHKCEAICHKGPCDKCTVQVTQVCNCHEPSERILDCSPGLELTFSCGRSCQKVLACDNHKCSKICHFDPEGCEICPKSPELVHSCHCGKTEIAKGQRQICTDEIPSCGQICGHVLNCGPVGNNHTCQQICHEKPCPKCPLTTEVKCRCGFMDREMDCSKLNSRADDAICEKMCSKKRDCLRHKCGQKCCIQFDHPCPLACGRLLSCGQHRCIEPCHRGNCSSCPNVSFDELSCFCGSEVIFPPVHCGVKPPHCSNTCTRAHPCGHPVMHNCHSEEHCPPCTALTEKRCYGGHEVRKSVACHIQGISCGRPCGKPLACGRHKCAKPCHPGECNDSTCSQPCQEPRQACGHPCNAACHDGTCPSTACLEKVKLNCACGHLTSLVMCSSSSGSMHLSLLAAHMRDLNNGNSMINLKELNRKSKIDCNEECAKLERNRRVALALQIENPDVSAKLAAPKYSDFLKEYAKKEPSFAAFVHDKLSELVKLAKESKHKSRSHSFEVMNRDKRQFVHELSDHFGIESESYDSEPKRNVVATAVKDKAWLPSQSIMDVVQGLRKAPSAPLNIKPAMPTFTTLQPSGLKSSASNNSIQSNSEEAKIDYFDFDG